MKHRDEFRPTVVIYAGDVPAVPSSPESGGLQTRLLSGPQYRAAPVVDPHDMAAEFPTRWAAYIRRFYPDDRMVVMQFGVSERTARKWRAGEMGCRAHHQSVALLTHGEDAFDMLVKP
ncbi:hypothetical protein N0B44_15700 [Roseibacterium beibuensis]|uniref:Uncharacterized protein n=1 Tax=[Roseibacterium] beibuensis TaxID=1193142 RepID=A0ABP9LCG4_9RHOB|nr:hypothetical protein [Roseibacterium beibuensis]MCS6624363.1 hypothetical protein [Roseibacterium beibuensis]